MHQALGVVDGVEEVKSVSNLVCNAQPYLPRQRHTLSPPETVGQRPVLHVLIDEARSVAVVAIGNQ